FNIRRQQPALRFPYTTLFRSLLQQRPERALLLLLQKGREDARAKELVHIAQRAGVRTEWRDAGELARLAGSEHHQGACLQVRALDRKSTRLNSSHVKISYAVF